MQSSMFIGLDVHKATISVAVAHGERGSEVRHWGTIPHYPDYIRLVGKLGVIWISAVRRTMWLWLAPPAC